MSTLAFIGAGNMASSLIGGWLEAAAASATATRVQVADVSDEQLQRLQQQFKSDSIATTTSAGDAVKGADLVVIAVKPNIVKTVCHSIGAELGTGVSGTTIPVVSVAAGVRCADMARWLAQAASKGGTQATPSVAPIVIRCMPNTPALLGAGVSGLYADSSCPAAVKTLAGSVLGAVGEVVWVNEETQLDAVTAVSGSGPAYFFYMMESMSQAGIELGLEPEAAKKLAIETAYGAALMARQGDLPPATLRKNVTSKGGTTAAALASFESDNFGEVVARGMQAARDQAIAMADEFGKE